jgi:hypothetical protein
MDMIRDAALAEVRALVRRGQSVPAIFVRSLLARLDQAEAAILQVVGAPGGGESGAGPASAADVRARRGEGAGAG